MQFTVFALASLIALALASPVAMPAAAESMSLPLLGLVSAGYLLYHFVKILTLLLDVVAREAIAGDSAPAMSDASGNVLPFDANAVTLPLQNAGQ